MLTTSRITPRMCESRQILLYTMRKKFTKGDVVKRIMREQKQCFGALLETKKEKIRRLKQEKKGALREADTNENDSELSWMLKVADSRLRLIRVNNDGLSLISGKTLAVESRPLREDSKPEELERSERALVGNKFVDTLILEETQIAKCAGSLRLPRVEIKRSILDRRPAKGLVADSSEAIADASIEEVVKLSDAKTAPTLEPGSGKIGESKQRKKLASRKSLESTNDRKISARPKDARIDLRTIEPMEKSWEISPRSKDTQIDYNGIESSGRIEPLPLFLSPEEIIENINEARLYDEEEDDLDRWSQTSEISCISRTQSAASSQLPSVTKILNLTMSEEVKRVLELWIAKMIEQLGPDGFQEYRRELLENGTLFHSSIDDALRKLPSEVPKPIERSFDSIKSVLKDVDHVRAIESHVVHHKLGYRGVLDCVASFRGKLCLIEWKQSQRMKNIISATYDAPLQIASYVGALNADKNYPFKVKSGAIVVGYTTGHKPTIYELDETKLQHYWRQWLKRLRKYYKSQIS